MFEAKSSRKRLGEELVERGLITKEQLWEALRTQSKTGDRLGVVLVRMGVVSNHDVDGILGICPSVSLDSIDSTLLKTVPEQLIRKYQAVPVKRDGQTLTLAMADPSNVLAMDDFRLILGCEVEPVQVSVEEIESAIQKHFGIPQFDKAFDDFDLQVAADEEDEQDDHNLVDDAPVVKLVNSIFLQAIDMNASDIHLEPQESGIRIRYRVDGVLREIAHLPRKIRPAVISRIKIMSEMDIAEKRVPQDGRIPLKAGTREIDLRVSTLPTTYGEKVVARLLDKSGMQNYRIEQLGFQPENLKKFRSALRNAYGMLLITGPTGSGKTTTLYAALNQINTIERNIVTVEDPVEYMLVGINQTQVNVKAGMTFAAGLRSILRQDPDVIMVGEIRDGETADIAMRAAITGHLVLSTLHTNDAAGCVGRLVDMGVEPFMVSASLLGVVAQRLVRRICTECKGSYQLPEHAPERQFMGLDATAPVTLYRGAGCTRCGNSGYKGRVAIHEVMMVSPALRPLISANKPADVLKQKAVEQGMITLKADGIYKVLEGITTVEGVMRVAYVGEE
ncbi:MAG: ATPase, T2SS/T4P/T4SS family [Eubacteriales bacterium]|nr:Flp pilus assembly complex ATPase component TadA [Bacillota bacterium]MBV1726646.1 Flp pilus assembly complex ATPase component TadA [Desulforudis sp.]MDP3050544.1 ATPase, T2SS/T4P/T4SS family [Eubacteriales bacterium]MBU4554634.1 Flp pilus assembly complex ATPase component TadA [Bacillota bacterium]MBV1735135.1 Flp pilus assembly complex ATPase component TadA [Desulforudis sp.]